MKLAPLILCNLRKVFFISQKLTEFPLVQCLSAYCVLRVSGEAPPVSRGLEISLAASENAEVPSYQTMGAFRIQVGLDLCGLEQLWKLLQERVGGGPEVLGGM